MPDDSEQSNLIDCASLTALGQPKGAALPGFHRTLAISHLPVWLTFSPRANRPTLVVFVALYDGDDLLLCYGRRLTAGF